VFQIKTILSEPEYEERLIQSLHEDFENLCAYDILTSNMSSTEREVYQKLKTNAKSGTSLKALFENSVLLTWIDHLEIKYPVLRMVSTLTLDQKEEELQEGVKEKVRLCKQIVLQRLRENTYKHTEYNRLNNRITYRDLQHQVTKKRRIWPLRKTIHSFKHEIFDLVPCWLASPEAVSAIFPMETVFDLVIFDEASQSFAEKGLPSIYRAKQVVVAGDEQQLSPYDLYQVRWDDEQETENTDLELDSLLDLSSRYFTHVWLKGHYRSRTLDLIDFSNRHFYKQKLKMLPDFEVVNNEVRGIDYIKVDGVWENNTNEKEAEEVTEQALSYLQETSSVGIVTFNYKQQQLIQDKIEEKAAKRKIKLPASLLIKNIENVQGDEREIIIFSIGYAPNQHGKVAARFGSLNLEKGENRLNVAVTRAKQKVVVVCSFLPHQLQVEEAKHPGPKLLKEYLHYAFEVSEGQYTPALPAAEHVHSSWQLSKKLEKEVPLESVSLQKDLPFCDLTARAGKNIQSLILTDDELYYQSSSSKEAHAYLPLLLKQKKWKFTTVYSRNYWSKTNETLQKLEKFVSS
jgi:hypothetical protein